MEILEEDGMVVFVLVVIFLAGFLFGVVVVLLIVWILFF